MDPVIPRMLPLEEVAEALHASVKDLIRLSRRGKFAPVIKLGRQRLVSASALCAWLDDQSYPSHVNEAVRIREIMRGHAKS